MTSSTLMHKYKVYIFHAYFCTHFLHTFCKRIRLIILRESHFNIIHHQIHFPYMLVVCSAHTKPEAE